MAGRQCENQALHPRGLEERQRKSQRKSCTSGSFSLQLRSVGERRRPEARVWTEKRLAIVMVGPCFPSSAGTDTVEAELFSLLCPEMTSWSGDAQQCPPPFENSLVFSLIRVLAST